MKTHQRGPLLVIIACGALIALTSGGEGPGNLGPRRKTSSDVTVMDFGAVGDGVHDDTDAIQKLIDSRTGLIRFPAGTYRLSKPIVLGLNKSGSVSLIADDSAMLVMTGPGPAIRFDGAIGVAAEPSVPSEALGRHGMALVQGVSIVGDHPEADGIEALGTIQLTLRGVSIRRCREGVHLLRRNSSVLIDTCHISENSGSGIFLDHVTINQVIISATHIGHCDGGGIVIRGDDVRNVRITGCDLESNGKQAGLVASNILADCADGNVAEVVITGCTLRNTRHVAHSANVRVLGHLNNDSANEPSLSACSQIAIGNNVISEAQTNIHLVGARGVTIVGNTICQGYAHNALIEESQEILVGQNVFTRRQEYGATEQATNNVVFRSSRDCTIQDLQLCHVQQGEAGITLDKCDRIHVDDCTILECDNVGILVRDCTRCRIGTSNLIHHSRGATVSLPIKAVGGSGNLIYDMEHYYPP